MRHSSNIIKCSHCKGNVSGHLCGDRVIYWCDECGANDKDVPPDVSIELEAM